MTVSVLAEQFLDSFPSGVDDLEPQLPFRVHGLQQPFDGGPVSVGAHDYPVVASGLVSVDDRGEAGEQSDVAVGVFAGVDDREGCDLLGYGGTVRPRVGESQSRRDQSVRAVVGLPRLGSAHDSLNRRETLSEEFAAITRSFEGETGDA